MDTIDQDRINAKTDGAKVIDLDAARRTAQNRFNVDDSNMTTLPGTTIAIPTVFVVIAIIACVIYFLRK